ncbi:MAG TPA: energy transducer TonB [Rhodospirillales bacterium]|nr:energy transducer TonB [Rhodospirillales bacterium]
MSRGILTSVLFHLFLAVAGYLGLPRLNRPELLVEAPIMVELVTVDDVTNAAPPPPRPEKKAKALPPPEPPKVDEPKHPQAAAPAPAPAPEPKPEIAAVTPSPDAKPKAKEKPKPKPKAKPKAKPKPLSKLAKVKPRRKPKPPDTFASVLKTLADLKKHTPQPKKKDKAKKPKKKESFERQIARALVSPTSKFSTDRPLTISEIDLVRQQIAKCWNLPSGAKDAENLVIEISVEMNPDGTPRQARIRDQKRLQTDPFFRAAAESALRAVLNQNCQPFKLPREKYDRWRSMTLVFNPKEMFGS